MSYTLEQFTDDCRDILKGTQDRAALEQVRGRLERGQTGIFDDYAIHSISYPAGARFVRITGVDLDSIRRGRFNPEDETMVVEYRNTLKDAR